MEIIAFSNERESKPYQVREYASAYYAGGYNHDYIVMNQTTADSYGVATHEYLHLLMRHTGVHIPLWLNEGLAEFHSTLRSYQGKVAVGEVIRHRYDTLQQKPLIPIAHLVTAERDSPLYNNQDQVRVFYAQSWALVHMMILSPEYRPRFAEFLSRFDTSSATAEVFYEIYGKTLPQVQKDLESYLRRLAFDAVLFPVALGKSAQTPEVSPAGEAETQVTLANLLFGLNKRDEARLILERLSGEFPSAWQVEEALGINSWVEGNHDQARAHLAAAVEEGTTNARTYLAYSNLMRETTRDATVLIPLLEKALQLPPQSREIVLQLATSYVGAQKYSQALGRLTGSFAPRQACQVYTLLARCYLGLDALDQAKEATAKAKPYARTSTETYQMEQLAKVIADRMDAKSRPAVQPPVKTAPTAATAVTETPPEPPVLNKNPNPELKGVLRQLDCLEGWARVTVESEGKQLALKIIDPSGVIIRGKPGATVSFDCGPQPGQPVLIQYAAEPDAKAGTIGRILVIEFLQPPAPVKK